MAEAFSLRGAREQREARTATWHVRCSAQALRISMYGENPMALNWSENKGCAVAAQRFTRRELAPNPISKLDDDAFTRVRIILMHGIETDALRFKHIAARLHGGHRALMANLRRVEQH